MFRVKKSLDPTSVQQLSAFHIALAMELLGHSFQGIMHGNGHGNGMDGNVVAKSDRHKQMTLHLIVCSNKQTNGTPQLSSAHSSSSSSVFTCC